MMCNRRQLGIVIVAIGASLYAAPAMPQAWPSKPITIVVSYPAGGDTDVLARTYAEKLSQRLGQQVVVDNRPGASGTIGNAAVAKSLPDGHTLLFAPSTLAIAQHVLKAGTGAAHDVNRDFTPIIKAGSVALLVVTSPNAGIKDMQQVIADARGGKASTYGSPGAGSPMHIAGEMLNKAAGVRITHVPYRGVAPVVNDAMGGHVTVGWVTPGAVASHLAGGKLQPLAVAEKQRTRSLPNVPTLTELGYRDLDVTAWFALLGPRGLPPEVVRTLNAQMNEILRLPDVAARMETMGVEPIGGDPAALAKTIAEDDERFGKLVKEFGIKVE